MTNENLPESGVLASGESHFLDLSQVGRKINQNYPDPEDNDDIVNTYPEYKQGEQNPIFNFNGIKGGFSSNTEPPLSLEDRLQPFIRPPEDGSKPRSETDFRVQDSYIHHKPYDGKAVEIYYLSSYTTSVDFNRYGSVDSYYNAGF